MDLCLARKSYKPVIPDCLSHLNKCSLEKQGEAIQSLDDENIKKHFSHVYPMPRLSVVRKESASHSPFLVGVVLSGGQAAGGHNVITGLFDAMKELHPQSKLVGFLNGPQGIIEGEYKFLVKEEVDAYRNQGGFDIIGSGRTKIETDEQLAKALRICKKLELQALIIIGGDDSNTNAALLAEYFHEHGQNTAVIGVPKTIDGDLQNEFVDISFGFDTACKTYSEMIGNIQRDALSSKKYYHFIKLMGRSASHIALECAMHTCPNYTFISEAVAKDHATLESLVNDLCDMVCERAAVGKNYGVVLIPEGLIEFIPEIKNLLKELNVLLADNKEFNPSALSEAAQKVFSALPKSLQRQLTLDRDPHGNVQVSHIQTELLLMTLVKNKLKEKKEYKGSFSPTSHFFGYEGRSALPSNFDATYCYSLGRVAALLAVKSHSGYMACITNLHLPANQWEAHAIPISSLLHLEERKGQLKPVIKKALVDLDGFMYQSYLQLSKTCRVEDQYQFPGPIQFFGDKSLTDNVPILVKRKKQSF